MWTSSSNQSSNPAFGGPGWLETWRTPWSASPFPREQPQMKWRRCIASVVSLDLAKRQSTRQGFNHGAAAECFRHRIYCPLSQMRGVLNVNNCKNISTR